MSERRTSSESLASGSVHYFVVIYGKNCSTFVGHDTEESAVRHAREVPGAKAFRSNHETWELRT